MSDPRARTQRQSRPRQRIGGRGLGPRRWSRWALAAVLLATALALALTPAFSTDALSKSKNGGNKASVEKSESKSDNNSKSKSDKKSDPKSDTKKNSSTSSKKESGDKGSKAEQSSKTATGETSPSKTSADSSTDQKSASSSESKSSQSSTSKSASSSSSTTSQTGQATASSSEKTSSQQSEKTSSQDTVEQKESQSGTSTARADSTPSTASQSSSSSAEQTKTAATPGSAQKAATAQPEGTSTASAAPAAATPTADAAKPVATGTPGTTAATSVTPGPSPSATAGPTQVAAAASGDHGQAESAAPVATGTPSPARQRTTEATSQEPTAEPAPKLASTSGDATASGSDTETALVNAQVSGVTTGGGTASATSGNYASGAVIDTGVATSESGVSVAIPAQGDSSGASSTSGSAEATGLSAENLVVNGSTGSVQVAGKNYADIENHSSHTTVVENLGQASATTGDAFVNYADSKPKNQSSSANGPQSAPVSDAGTTGHNTVSGSLASTTVVSGGLATTSASGSLTTNAPAGAVEQQVASTAGSTPVPVATGTAITVQHEQQVTLESGGAAAVSSEAACATTKCAPHGAAAQGGAGGVSAASGSALANGLEAQNVVTTQGEASVQVKGENHGLITLVIETITKIFNHGEAKAVSGHTQSVEYAMPASGTSDSLTASGKAPTGGAKSGGADATGAWITNEVELRSEAAVHVVGDNYNPINLLLEMVVNLTNWGSANASSGDAAAGGKGGSAGSSKAASGSTSATGLQVQNLVNLGGLATVNIEGDNYAPITVWIRFISEIENEGFAQAKSGNVQSGDELTRKDSKQFRTASGLVVDARKGKALLEEGLLSTRSGSSVAMGNQNSVAIINYQLAAAANPGGESVAFNAANFLIDSWGMAGASSGGAYAGTPPPPPPSPPSPPSSTAPPPPQPVEGWAPGGVVTWSYLEQPPLPEWGWWVIEGYPVGPPPGVGMPGLPVGTMVGVDVEPGWPAGALLPMPAPRGIGETEIYAPWPSGELLGTPWPPDRNGGSGSNLAPFPWPGRGSSAAAGSMIEVDPWSLWPGAMGLSMPDQVASETALQGRSENDGLTRRPRALTPEALAGFLAAGGLAIGGLWRRRALVVAIALNSLVGLRAAVLLFGRLWLISFVRLWCLAVLVGVSLAWIWTL